MQKSAAFDEALKRYEDTLRNDQSTVEKQKQHLQERVQSAERDKSNEKDKKRQAQTMYRDSILKQIAE